MSNEKTPVKISLATLKKQVEEGMKRKELAEYYGIPETQMAKALKSAGLKIRKFHNPAFELVMETEEVPIIEEVEEATSTFSLPIEENEEIGEIEESFYKEVVPGTSKDNFNPLNY